MDNLTVKILNGTLKLPETIRSTMKVRDGESMLLEPNEDGSITIRRKETFPGNQNNINKGDTPEIHVNRVYNLQFETS